MPLLPLKPMAQSRRGVVQIMERLGSLCKPVEVSFKIK
jgi:hypothetical protein